MRPLREMPISSFLVQLVTHIRHVLPYVLRYMLFGSMYITNGSKKRFDTFCAMPYLLIRGIKLYIKSARSYTMTTARLYNAAKAQQVEGKKMILELSDGQRFNVKGSREANKICNELNAKPWNF